MVLLALKFVPKDAIANMMTVMVEQLPPSAPAPFLGGTPFRTAEPAAS